jgi:hypothetical protein
MFTSVLTLSLRLKEREIKESSKNCKLQITDVQYLTNIEHASLIREKCPSDSVPPM